MSEDRARYSFAKGKIQEGTYYSGSTGVVGTSESSANPTSEAGTEKQMRDTLTKNIEKIGIMLHIPSEDDHPAVEEDITDEVNVWEREEEYPSEEEMIKDLDRHLYGDVPVSSHPVSKVDNFCRKCGTCYEREDLFCASCGNKRR